MKKLAYFKTNYQKLLPSDKSASILDFGCGDGIVLTYLHELGYSNLHGTDIISNPAWTELRNTGIQLNKFDNTIDFLTSVKGKFDFIFVKDVIYYFKHEEVVAIIKLIKAALKPNGKILFDVINGSVLTGAYTKIKDFDIQLVLTEHSIVTLIERADLSVIHLKGNKPTITGLGSFLFYIVNELHKLRLRFLYFSERGIDSQNPKIYTKKIIAVATV